jgi:hypothetical protein
MFKDVIVYIAGPYTIPEPIENTRKAIDVWKELQDLGFTAVVPHNTLLLHLVYPETPEFWYDYDLQLMYRCDCVLRMDGESYGADEEVRLAKKHGIRVYYGIDAIRKAYGV